MLNRVKVDKEIKGEETKKLIQQVQQTKEIAIAKAEAAKKAKIRK